MKSSRTVGLVILALIIIGVIAYAMSNKQSATPNPTATPATSSPAVSASPSTSASPAPAPAAAAVISYDGSTFSPAQITVKSGQTVTFKNNSTKTVDVDSDPHPVHTDDPELNAGVITAGQSKTVTVTKTGTFGIHNHLNPTQRGSVTVQ